MYASTEVKNVLATWSKLGDLCFPAGADIVVKIHRVEDMARATREEMRQDIVPDLTAECTVHVPPVDDPMRLEYWTRRGKKGKPKQKGDWKGKARFLLPKV